MEQSARLQSAVTKHLFILGNKIAETKGYRSLSGIDALQYYLMQKHNWLPSQVKNMSMEDLSFCMEEDQITK
jgi:hypothetical protein